MPEPIVNEEPVIEVPKPETVVTEPAPKPGEKTDPALLLEALHKEREEKKEERRLRLAAEEALLARNTPENTVVEFSDEGKILLDKIASLEKKSSSRDEKDRLNAVQSVFPALKDKFQEFEDFRNNPENAGMQIETAAKAFLVENDLLEKPQTRKGLERETGGTREPVKQGRTPEEVDELRTTNYRQYVKELKAGTLYG